MSSEVAATIPAILIAVLASLTWPNVWPGE